ncbi:uncharacterized protein LOC141971455 [Athene noctua]|uniref:uncharacterized protein LOC141971455 n=1 Tax=Athene noctua TaxID=126797 RepID=UPI003EBAEA15
MSYALLGTLLLLLPGAASAEGRWIQQRQRQLWARLGETAELDCDISNASDSADWYREKPDGSLNWIYRSSVFSSTKGKYTGKKRTQRIFSLSISGVQREDSGVYYCSSSDFLPLFGKGTMLIVTNATEPELSILVPVDAEEPPARIPLLCHLRDVPRGWDTVRWQPGGEVTAVTASALDERGVLSAWSIAWVPAQRWDGAATCTALESGTGRNLSVAIAKGLGEGQCPSWPLALGLPCVSLLFLLQLILLLCRRRLPRDGSTPARR